MLGHPQHPENLPMIRGRHNLLSNSQYILGTCMTEGKCVGMLEGKHRWSWHNPSLLSDACDCSCMYEGNGDWRQEGVMERPATRKSGGPRIFSEVRDHDSTDVSSYSVRL